MHEGFKLNVWDIGGQKSIRPSADPFLGAKTTYGKKPSEQVSNNVQTGGVSLDLIEAVDLRS